MRGALHKKSLTKYMVPFVFITNFIFSLTVIHIKICLGNVNITSGHKNSSCYQVVITSVIVVSLTPIYAIIFHVIYFK